MKNLNFPRIIGAIVLVVIVVLLAKFGWDKLENNKQSLNADSYYAVFLTNNQVYFGHLSDVNDQYVTLKNIYYLQLAKPLQSTDSKDTQTLEDNNKSQLTLIKLGKELHGPKDQMTINRDSVTFFEELTGDSKVVQTIQKSENK